MAVQRNENKMNTVQTISAPLYEALKAHAEQGRASFHTPGHKGNCAFLPLDRQYDLTELPDTDSLFEASGCIRESERKAARLFGAAYTAVSSGGCTLAIQGMLAAFAGTGSKVIFCRNIHRSAVNTAALLGIAPVWVSHRCDGGEGLPGRVCAEDIRRAIEKNPDAAAVYLTSPDYYGCLSDIKGIAEICSFYEKPLLVDNAHGTHLISFGMHPITLGAAASACSAHKTLPVLTGGAWLNCNDEAIGSKIKSSMALFGSTSPSYLPMASLDLARDWMEREGIAAFRELAGIVSGLREVAASVGFGLPQGECDPVRLTLLTRPMGMTGDEAAEYFRRKGVECEHSDGGAVVFILTPFNSETDIDRLRHTIGAFPKGRPITYEPIVPDELPMIIKSPREALLSRSENIPVPEAAGRIAAEAACPCPPGVPVVMPGELIDKKCVNILLKTGITRINVIE